MIESIAALAARIKNDPAVAAKITENTDLINEIGLDSLQMIDFLLALEEEFQVVVDFEALDMAHLTRVGALCSFIEGLRRTTTSEASKPGK
jgi:acyl carrier protein